MIRALIAKELREISVVALLALAAYLVNVLSMMGSDAFRWFPILAPRKLDEVPFVGSTFNSYFWMISVLFCLAMGFWQTIPEDSRDTYRLLLHRSTSREWIIGTKFVVGVLSIWAAASVPILLLGAWAAKPGNCPSPFEWSMTNSAWEAWFTLPILYLGAFVSGLRPARWIGTRLIPLIAAVFLMAVDQTFVTHPIGHLLVPAAILLFVGAVMHIARERDFA